MQFVNRKKLLRAVAAVTFGMSCVETARAVVPEYTILDLSTLGGGTSDANGINNAGQVIGTSLTATNVQRAFLTAPNSAINPATNMLPLLSGGSLNKAYGVNATGQVAGWGTTSSGDRAYRYTGGVASSLGTLGGDWSYGQAINTLGQVVGSAATKNGNNSPTRAMLYSGSTMYNLGVLNSADDSL